MALMLVLIALFYVVEVRAYQQPSLRTYSHRKTTTTTRLYRHIYERRKAQEQTLALSAQQRNDMGVSLASLKTFEKDGKWLGESIQSWLDKEWIVMDFHRKLGLEVENIYIQQRLKGVEDLGEMLMEVGTSLELYDMKEAFVSAWDVGNKVSDLLMVRLDRELCSCMGDMSQFQSTSSGSSTNIGPISSKIELAIANEMQFYGSSEFNRYKLLRDFLDGTETMLIHIYCKITFASTSFISRSQQPNCNRDHITLPEV